MKNIPTTYRVLELVALLMIGEGIMGLLNPRRHSLLWTIGPAFMRDTYMYLAKHRGLGRCVYAVEALAGLLLAVRATSCFKK